MSCAAAYLLVLNVPCVISDNDDDDSTPCQLAPPVTPFRRKPSQRHQHGAGRGRVRRPSVNPSPPVQLLSIPQLDAIQRSLKLLDVRLQHIQSKAKDDEKTKDDVEHIRQIMSENQKALGTIVTVLSSIQEEVRVLSITVHKQQQNTFTLQAPSRKRESKERANSTASTDRQTDRLSMKERDKDIRSVLNMDLSEV